VVNDKLQKSRLLGYQEQVIFPPSFPRVDIDQVTTNSSLVTSLNDLCRVFPGRYNPYFTWLPASHYRGEQQVLGQKVDVFYLNVIQESATLNLTLAVLQSNNSIPVQYNITQIRGTVYPPLVTVINFLDFQDLTSNPPDESNFDIDPSCYQVAPPCEQGPVEKKQWVRIHPNGDTSLDNENVGTLSGDTGFICTAALSGFFPTLTQVSLFELLINTTYGEYGFCNFKTCLGGSPTLVGRESPATLGYRGNQCNEEAGNLTGFWYSLPAQGQCKGTEDPSSGQCTWKKLSLIKTIEQKCLYNQHNFVQACLDDGVIPFPKATAILKKALEETDPKKGGCPAI